MTATLGSGAPVSGLDSAAARFAVEDALVAEAAWAGEPAVAAPGGAATAVPEMLRPAPGARRRQIGPRAGAAIVGGIAGLPLLALLVSLLVGGGPKVESADDALLTMAARDVFHGQVFLGPYSRFGWHHLGPAYLFVLSVPTRLWGGGPTGSWVGSSMLAVAGAAAIAAMARRWSGAFAGWWAAIGVLLAVAGLGGERFRDPWNPYVVILPLLLTIIAAAMAAAGRRHTLPVAMVVGSLVVQTHVSTVPIVGMALAVAAAAQLLRRRAGGAPATIERRSPVLIVSVALLVLMWAPPAWDEVVGTHNLSDVVTFFLSPHPTHGLAEAWRLCAAMFGIVMWQHHAALHDNVADLHPLVTTAVFLGLVVVAVAGGVRGRRPEAAWLGGLGLVSGVLAMLSITRIVGEPYRYLLVWMSIIPVVAFIGAAIGVEAMVRRRPAGAGRMLVAGLTATAVVAALGLAGWAVRDTIPAAGLSNPDVIAATGLLTPVLAGVPGATVRIEINNGERWPTAAGVGLELERAGHPIRVRRQWTLLFGRNRLATGREPVVIVVSRADPGSWPRPVDATLVGVVGPTYLFVARAGPACWWGWVPFGGPACPVVVPPTISGPPTAPAPVRPIR